MDYHGITMKGKYFMEQVSNLSSGVTGNQRRIVYNTSTSMNGTGDAFGQYKLFYHNNSQWVRPLLANQHDGPYADNQIYLGSGTYRFARIYSVNFYGAVRYS